jgi:anhydro-N-acetylmuramic acid kinase
MSGTSLDGIDVALLHTDGETLVKRGPARTYPYDASRQTLLRQALAEARPILNRSDRLGHLAETERQLTAWHAEAVQRFLAETGVSGVDVVGFHGQTVLHRPEIRLTLQLGDGPALARALGLPVVYDLRAADVAAGGQGAPLVPVYHRALVAHVKQRPVALVNIGGVANITWVGPDEHLIAFDTGPGNALINDWCMARRGEVLDSDGRLAAQGKVNTDALAQLLSHPHFSAAPPKSLDRNSFTSESLAALSDADGAATLTAFTAGSIANAARLLPQEPAMWIIGGGGRHNPTLMAMLKQALEPRGQAVVPAEDIAADGDAMEAEAWAYLAVRSLDGKPITFPMTTRAPAAMTGGVLALP